MSVTARTIRTPDQRLRVFVSSTLKELAAERRAVRAAVERLHLAPVMFELGARPHPPRELYRAYLEQSDLFVGLYWEKYGWVAPEEQVSGLEDEYNLAPATLPKLMYIKEPADAREPRLVDLLGRIRHDDMASFKYFSTASELAKLVEADLATLLAERFDESRAAAQTLEARAAELAGNPAAPARNDVPVPLTELIGREGEAAELERMLSDDTVRLVTLTGPGGIGKSRLALEVAKALSGRFAGGATFVPLSPVRDPDLVANAIAQAIGVRDTGDAPIVDKLVTALRERRVLLVLDNFEQVIGAAPGMAHLLVEAPGLTLLVTSRALLRVSGERSFEVGPLGLPDLSRRSVLADVVASPAVVLFIERARAVKPDFEVGLDNVDAVARICESLDGVPLALELAAARIRVLSPASLLERLDRRLAVLVGGARDLPERQQTLRNTIEWSAGLLDDEQRRMLARLGVFRGGFSLEAAEAVAVDSPDVDVLTVLGELVDNSLISQQDRRTWTRFIMLATVREYALEQLDADELATLRERLALYYLDLGDRIEFELEGPRQHELVQRLTDARDNLRAVQRYLLDAGRYGQVAHLAWALYVYWWVGGHLGEVRRWADEILDSGKELDDLTRAIAVYFTASIGFWQDPDGMVAQRLTEAAELFHRTDNPGGEGLALSSLAVALLARTKPEPEQASEALETAVRLFRESGDAWGESLALVTLGRFSLATGQAQAALDRFEESLALTRERHDELGETIAIHHVAWAHLALGQKDAAAEEFRAGLEESSDMGHDEGMAYGLEGMVAIAAMLGAVERAGRMLGAAQALREQSGLTNSAARTLYQPFVDAVLAGEQAEDFERARAAGRELTLSDAVDYALERLAAGDGR